MLVDKIYRNRKNLAYCKGHGVRISGPALDRAKKETIAEKKQSYRDNTDRIEVERRFSLAKRCYGLGLIRTKLDTTTRSSIDLSILAINLKHLTRSVFLLIMISIFSRYIWRKNPPQKSIYSIYLQAADC